MYNETQTVVSSRERKIRIDRERLLDTAVQWFPMERKRKAEKIATVRKLIGILIPLALVFASLMLLVHSSVMMSAKSTEYERLRGESADLELEAEWLKNKLTVKNDILEIESIARNKLGMVKEEYLNSHYVSVLADEGVEYYGTSQNESVLVSLLGSLRG
ncbi:MAG: hypothetical protein IKS35_06170 [Clostridia bacterium]|nr:hypothetical protein [Clostridia bacterium]